MNECCCYDFTIFLTQNGKEIWRRDEFPILKKQLSEICKSGTFQLEEGQESGKLHWQGRISLKKKMRKTALVKIARENFLRQGIYWSITSNANRGNDEYVTKDHTRVAGPWNIKEKIDYIPRQVREIKELRPFQQHIIDDADVWNTRTINWVYQPEGCVGKSILKTYLRVHKLGRPLPPCNDMKDILRMVHGMPTSRLYIVDLPKAMKKDKLFGLLGAIETVKDGYCYDDRYHFKEKNFDCPNIWVFSNMLPDLGLLSNDRWKIWNINSKYELVEHHVNEENTEF